MMSSSKKRKNDTEKPTQDSTIPPSKKLKQAAYLVRKAACRIFKGIGPNYGPVTNADLAAADAVRVETGQRVWPVVHDDPDEYHDNRPEDIQSQASEEASVELGMDISNGKELRVWWKTFEVDKGMPMEVDEGTMKICQRKGLKESMCC